MYYLYYSVPESGGEELRKGTELLFFFQNT